MLNWISMQLKNIGAFFTGNAAWLEQQDKELQQKIAAYNSTMRWITGISFVAGLAVGLWIGG